MKYILHDKYLKIKHFLKEYLYFFTIIYIRGCDKMIYITRDTHIDFTRLNNIDKNNMLIILGDAGINYFLNDEDAKLKEYLNSYNIKLFCIRGYHEERA